MLAPIRLLRPAMYRFLSHSWIKPRSPTNTALFPTGNLRFILGSSPENRNALGSAVVDNLHQERPRLKYGYFFFFFCYHEGHILFEELPLEKKKKTETEKKRLSIDWEALVCFMNDDIEFDAPDKTSHTFHQKSQTEKRKKKRNVHLSSAYNLTAKPCSPHAHHLFIHLVHSCLCI